jgi:hypothetical protein
LKGLSPNRLAAILALLDNSSSVQPIVETVPNVEQQESPVETNPK